MLSIYTHVDQVTLKGHSDGKYRAIHSYSKTFLAYNFIDIYCVCLFSRAKYHKLKYGTELNQGDLKPPVFEKKDEGEVYFNTS